MANILFTRYTLILNLKYLILSGLMLLFFNCELKNARKQENKIKAKNYAVLVNQSALENQDKKINYPKLRSLEDYLHSHQIELCAFYDELEGIIKEIKKKAESKFPLDTMARNNFEAIYQKEKLAQLCKQKGVKDSILVIVKVFASKNCD